MKATSLLAMTAALSLLVGTSAASAQQVNPELDLTVILQDDGAETTINDSKVNQSAAINKQSGSLSAIGIFTDDGTVGNVTNIGDTVQNTVNTGAINNRGRVVSGNHTGHGDSGSVSAVGAASTVAVSISSVSGQ